MKPKKFKKTLVLNKKTIAHLNKNAMGNAYGGENPGDSNPCILTITFQCCPTYLPPGVSEGEIVCRCADNGPL